MRPLLTGERQTGRLPRSPRTATFGVYGTLLAHAGNEHPRPTLIHDGDCDARSLILPRRGQRETPDGDQKGQTGAGGNPGGPECTE